MDTVVTRKMNILLVEGMAELTDRVRRIIATSDFTSRVHTVGDSTETLAYLRHQAPYGRAPTPDLVLLGLSLSRSANRDIIDEIASNPRLIGLNVVRLEDPRFSGVVADDPAPAGASHRPNAITLPALGELIDRVGSSSPSFSRSVGAI